MTIVIILAAGSSTRLGPLTRNVPKGLLNIGAKPIIQKQIELFCRKKISDIFIVTGPNSEKFNFKNVTYIKDKNYEEHDVLGSLMAARSIMNTDMLMCYSDILFDDKILDQMLNFQGDIGIAVEMNWLPGYENRTQHTISEADNVFIDNGKVSKIRKNMIEEMKNEKLGEFVGIMCLSSKGAKDFVLTYERLEKSHKGSFHNAPSIKKAYLTDMLQELINLNFDVMPIICKGEWCEIDTPQDLEEARKKF